MAFVINAQLNRMEYRSVRSGVGKESGKTWMSLVLEDENANQLDVSVPSDLQGDVYGLGLRKGDIITVAIRAVARNDGNSYVQLRAIPELEDQGLITDACRYPCRSRHRRACYLDMVPYSLQCGSGGNANDRTSSGNDLGHDSQLDAWTGRRACTD